MNFFLQIKKKIAKENIHFDIQIEQNSSDNNFQKGERRDLDIIFQKVNKGQEINFDNDIRKMGSEISIYHSEKGFVKFQGYAKEMINDIDEDIVNSFVLQPSTNDANSTKNKNFEAISKNTTYRSVYYTRPIGDIYEEYIGHLLENNGYSVEYNGIEKRRKDEGIDLIATKDNITLLIQCKCWKKTTVISKSSINSINGKSKYNCIARLYVQAKLYALHHNIKQYVAVLYYTCEVSESAKFEADKYNIILKRELLPSWKKC
ncbi:restriction endonuclease [bacterium]|nr:restriction endonuclease [bacterium]